MRRFLLSAFAALACMATATAAVVEEVITIETFGVTKATTYQDVEYTSTTTGITYKGNLCKSNAANGSCLQFRTTSKKEAGLVATANPQGAVIKSVKVEPSTTATTTNQWDVYGKSAVYSTFMDLYSTETAGSLIGSGTTAATVTPTNDFVGFGFRGNGGAIYIQKITITYEIGAEAPKVVAPVIEMVEMGEGFKVTMTTETEGAEIRYTTNGDEPTATSTLYSAPIDIWETTTFKTVAIKDGEMSRVATFVANPPMVLENFMPLGDADPSEVYSILVKGKMTAVYQYAQYLYVKDDSNNFALVYDGTVGKFTNGDTFNRLEGTFVTYNGQPEFKNVTIGEVTPGTPVEPTEAYLDEIAAYNLNKYFKIEGVAISGINGLQATLTDVDGTTAVLYNRFKLDQLTEGENFTITGFVAVYEKDGVTTYQFYPTEIVAAAETPAAPVPTIKVGETVITEGSVDLKEGEVAEVSFELAEGVEVYYNLTETGIEKAAAEDGLEYTKYTEPIRISKASTLTYYSVVNGVESEKATFTVTGGTTAITEINADANAPVEYFNLQGIRVANPENGVFIRRQGNTVTKVVK